MKFSFSKQSLPELSVDLVVISAFENEEITGLDEATNALLLRAAKEEFFEGKSEQTLNCLAPSNKISRVLVIGMGKRDNLKSWHWRNFAAKATRFAKKVSAKKVGFVAPEDAGLRFALEGCFLGDYVFNRYKGDPPKRSSVEEVVLQSSKENPNIAEEAKIIASSVAFARDLVNEPAIVMTPTTMAEKGLEIAKEFGLESKVFGPKECAEQKMGLFLAVGQGSQEEGRFLHLIYRPKTASGKIPRLAFVGKGITFDSGGLSLKPPKAMVGMQYDMSGAAAVLGAMRAIAQLKPNVEVHGITPLTENMPSGSSYRPSDVIRSMSGKTVEVLNTDAEGRLVLADALWYATQLKPDAIVNLATLTGACLVALGSSIAGAFGSDKALLDRVLSAADTTGEDMWHMPTPDKMRESLKGDIGDLKNVTGESWGGAIVAALFLQEFTDNFPWVHLDIAGPASTDKDIPLAPKGGTGFGVMTLVELARRYSE